MTKIVYKVELPEPGQPKQYAMTYGFIIRLVALQNHKPMLWFEVTVEEQSRTKIEVIGVGTGWPVDTEFWYLGTIITESGLVWHYYAKFINE